MKRIMILLALIAFICTVSFAQETEEQTKIKNLILTMYNSSVSIFSIGRSGSAICSGVVLNNTFNNVKILTAKHCIDIFEETFVEDVKIDYIITSATDDLAILVLSEKISNKVAIKMASYNLQRNDFIYHIGFPELDIYPSVGIVFLRASDYSYAKMKVIPGCSGGGAFNDKGELVGIVTATIKFGEGLTLYEPLNDIERFLKTIKK